MKRARPKLSAKRRCRQWGSTYGTGLNDLTSASPPLLGEPGIEPGAVDHGSLMRPFSYTEQSATVEAQRFVINDRSDATSVPEVI